MDQRTESVKSIALSAGIGVVATVLDSIKLFRTDGDADRI